MSKGTDKTVTTVNKYTVGSENNRSEPNAAPMGTMTTIDQATLQKWVVSPLNTILYLSEDHSSAAAINASETGNINFVTVTPTLLYMVFVANKKNE